MFVVPKNTGSLWLILNLKQFNHFMHIPTFTMPTKRCIWQSIQHVIMLSALISRMLIYIFLLLSTIIIFYDLFDRVCHISGKFYAMG